MKVTVARMHSHFPKISVVTPSFNQAEFLERTICSVLDQAYPNLEYIVIDGGSTDGSVEIIQKYADRLAYWVSEPDRGQTDAINKGLKRATGEWVGWQNSDDIYYPGAFADVAELAQKHPGADLLIGNMVIIDAADKPLRDIRYVRPSYQALLAEGMLMANQAAFWRRQVHEQIGWMDESLQCSFDYEWFLRLTKQGKGIHINHSWGGFRLHGETKTSKWAQRFADENALIRQGRTVGRLEKIAFQLRRLFLMLAQGDVAYALRGIARRASGRDGGLY